MAMFYYQLIKEQHMIRGMVISSIKDTLSNSNNRVSTVRSATAINYTRNAEHHYVFRENSTNQGRFSIPSLEKNTSSPTARTDCTME